MKKWLLLLPSIFLGSLLLSMLIFFDKTDQITTEYISKVSPEAEIIARVGNENIYKKDLDFELLYLPYETEDQKRKTALDKLTRDSIILQAASEKNLISLDKTVFNSVEKDYFKRLDLVRNAELAVELNTETIEGILVSVMFWGNSAKDTSYTDYKDIALAEIRNSRNFYIKENASSDQLEVWFRKNENLKPLLYEIKTIYLHKDESLGLNHRLEDEMWATTKGGVTDIYIGVDKPSIEELPIDSKYSYIIVTDRLQDDISFDFNTWYSEISEEYKVVVID